MFSSARIDEHLVKAETLLAEIKKNPSGGKMTGTEAKLHEVATALIAAHRQTIEELNAIQKIAEAPARAG